MKSARTMEPWAVSFGARCVKKYAPAPMAARISASAMKSWARLRCGTGAVGVWIDVFVAVAVDAATVEAGLVELANGATAAVDAAPVPLSGVAVVVATFEG